MRQMFWYSPRGDQSLAPCWGVSIDFIPRITASHVVAWHASTSQAQADIMARLPYNHPDLFHTHGPGPIRKDHIQVLTPALQEADRFWAVCSTPASLYKGIHWARA